MQKDICKITGPVFPIITPFRQNGEIDYVILEKYLKFLVSCKVQNVYVMAHSSRLGLLTTQEIIDLNEFVCGILKPYHLTVITATGLCGSTADHIAIAHRASVDGADLVSVLFSERYYCDEQIVEFYTTISKSINCGVLVHEEGLNAKRGCEKIQWPMPLLKKVLVINGVVALKEDSHDDMQTETILREFRNTHSIIVSGGGKGQFLDFAPLCDAYLVGVGSFIPQLAMEFYSRYTDGDFNFCKQIVAFVEKPFFELAMNIGWHLALKSAMEHVGMMPRYERRPLTELNLTEHVSIGNITDRAVSAAKSLLGVA